MASTRQFVRSWSGGEIAPELFGRLDDARYQQGAEKLRNFVCRVGGSLQRRPGFDFVRETKDSSKRSRLIPFVYSTGQAYAIEMGEGYFRFHADGGTLLHVRAREVASVSDTADTVTFTQPHGFTSNETVRMFRDLDVPGVIPTGLSSGTTYYAIPVDTHTIQVSASSGPGAAVNITSTGTLPLWMYSVADCPAQYISSKNLNLVTATVSSVNTGTEEMTTSASHGLTTGDAIAFPTAVGGLTAGQVYYANVVSPTVFKVCASYASAIAGVLFVNLTAATTGTVILADLVNTSSAHGLGNGDPVTFTVSGGTIITGGLATGRTYYARPATANNLKLYTTAELASAAAADTNVKFTGAGTGTTRMHYRYQPGDIVTNLNSPAGFYSCRIDDPQDVTPGSDPDAWHYLPLNGVFEIPNDYDEADLFEIHHAQSADIKTLVHQSYPPTEMRRRGATQWDFTPIAFNEGIDAPTGATMTPTSGATSAITAVDAPAPGTASTLTTNGGSNQTNHFLFDGDLVYIYEPGGNTIGTVPSNTFYVVTETPTVHSFKLREVSGGGFVRSTTTTITGSPQVRVFSATSETAQFYRVTAVDADGRESPGSNATGGVNNLLAPGAFNTITWNDVVGADRYNIYRARNGIYGYIGTTSELSFVDDNIAPDMTTTLPQFDTSLDGVDYPGAVAYFEGRRVFGGTFNQPQTVWMTNTSLPDSLIYHVPVQDTDRLVFQPDSTEASTIQHFVPLQHLVAITNAAEYRIGGLNTDPITPDSISVRPQSYVGGSSVQPIVVNRTIVFVAFLGGHLFEMGYTANDGYQAADLCLRSPHLFDDATVVDLAYVKSPVPILWAVSSDGRLLGCTYAPEEQVGGWHVHTTQSGTFESVCAIPEGDEYRLYAIVNRTIDGATVRNVERLNSLKTPATLAEARHVDGGGQFYGIDTTGTAISVTPASSWANGSTVTIGVSSGGPIFRTGSPSPDIGDRVTFAYLGRLFDATITAVTNGSSATATLAQAVTDANGTTLVFGTVPSIGGITLWGFKRDSLSGLDHLEGEVVQVLADGVLTTKTVSSGAITGLTASLRITYGLPIVSELLTLPLLYGSDSYGQARTGAISEVWLRTRRSETFQVAQGEDGDQVPFAADFDNDNTVDRCMPRGRWDETGQLYVLQDGPYPLTLVSMTIKASIGS